MHNEFGIYERMPQTGPYTREDVEALQLIPMMQSWQTLFEGIVNEAIERNRASTEDHLQAQRTTIETDKNIKPGERKKWRERLSFDRWRADALRGRVSRFVPDATDQEADALQALGLIDELRRCTDIQMAAFIGYRLGRVVERVQVRPYEESVERTQRKRKGNKENSEQRHGTAEWKAQTARRVRKLVDEKMSRSGLTYTRCCKDLANQGTILTPDGEPYKWRALVNLYLAADDPGQ